MRGGKWEVRGKCAGTLHSDRLRIFWNGGGIDGCIFKPGKLLAYLESKVGDELKEAYGSAMEEKADERYDFHAEYQ